MSNNRQNGVIAIVLLFVFLLMLGGCAMSPPAPIEDREQGDEIKHRPVDPLPFNQIEIEPGVATPPAPSVTPPAPVAAPINPAQGATQQLLAAADADIAHGQYEAAAVSVERAIRITPDDPWAWHKFAQLSFRSGDYLQAKATARRSSALPGASPRLIAANWLLIAEIERISGNTAAAELADAKARSQVNRTQTP